MLLLHILWVAAGYLLVGVFGALASWRGGWAERSATLIIWVAWGINPSLQTEFDPGLATLAVDTSVTIFLVAIAHYSRRVWSVLAAACAMAAVICQLVKPLANDIGFYAFNTVLGLLGGIYIALALAVAVLEVEIIRRRRRVNA